MRQLHRAGRPPSAASLFQQQLDIAVEFGQCLPFRRSHRGKIVRGQRPPRGQGGQMRGDPLGDGTAAGSGRGLVR